MLQFAGIAAGLGVDLDETAMMSPSDRTPARGHALSTTPRKVVLETIEPRRSCPLIPSFARAGCPTFAVRTQRGRCPLTRRRRAPLRSPRPVGCAPPPVRTRHQIVPSSGSEPAPRGHPGSEQTAQPKPLRRALGPTAPRQTRLVAAYECQALAALRSTVWSIRSRKRIPSRPRFPGEGRTRASDAGGLRLTVIRGEKTRGDGRTRCRHREHRSHA